MEKHYIIIELVSVLEHTVNASNYYCQEYKDGIIIFPMTS